MVGDGELQRGTSGMGESGTTGNEAAFLERIRRALAHDLRTPLGTITNYAAILEYQGDSKPADVRLFAGRIRQSAVRAAMMLQHVTDAIVLSGREPTGEGVDLAGLVRSLLAETSVRARFPARGEELPERVPIDGELVAFAWRAFLAIHAEAAGDAMLDVDVEVASDAGSCTVDFSIGARPAEAPARVGASRWAESSAGTNAPEACFALGLAEDLIRMRGGDMGLWGRPGQGSSLRVSLPRGA
jgi:two-component system sensor histidine kinase MtrB